MCNKNTSRASDAQRRSVRLARLPHFVQQLANNRAALRQYLTIASLTRALIAGGQEPTPGYGLAQHDAGMRIMRYFAGEITLDDDEFEMALRTMTPPEAMQ